MKLSQLLFGATAIAPGMALTSATSALAGPEQACVRADGSPCPPMPPGRRSGAALPGPAARHQRRVHAEPHGLQLVDRLKEAHSNALAAAYAECGHLEAPTGATRSQRCPNESTCGELRRRVIAPHDAPTACYGCSTTAPIIDACYNFALW